MVALIQRPYETPHDYDNQANPKNLPMGCAMKGRLMIPDQKHRQVLHRLVQLSLSRGRKRASGLRLVDCQPFKFCIDEHRPALKPVIDI